jgi:hypothetical protein
MPALFCRLFPFHTPCISNSCRESTFYHLPSRSHCSRCCCCCLRRRPSCLVAAEPQDVGDSKEWRGTPAPFIAAATATMRAAAGTKWREPAGAVTEVVNLKTNGRADWLPACAAAVQRRAKDTKRKTTPRRQLHRTARGRNRTRERGCLKQASSSVRISSSPSSAQRAPSAAGLAAEARRSCSGQSSN